MMKNVVKTDALADFLLDVASLITSDDMTALCRTRTSDFTRRRSFPASMLLQYLIFRNHRNTQGELTNFFTRLSMTDQRISRQAFYKAAHKLNPSALSTLIHRFAETFYRSDLVKKHRGYIVLAEDGTFLEIPMSDRNIRDFGFVQNKHVKDFDDVKSVHAKCGGLYDVTNGLMVDFTFHRSDRSEIPVAFEHLYRNTDTFGDNRLLYLADRYYGSAELISYLESEGISYCIRGKSNFYKKQVAAMTSDDEWIDVEVDEKWVRRFRFSPEAVQTRKKNPHMRIRCVKTHYEYVDEKDEKHEVELLFFTNLPDEEFSSEDIAALYGWRWDIEVSYKTQKSTMEIERYVSEDSDLAKACVLAKIVFHNIAGIFRKELNRYLEVNHNPLNKYQYAVNISQLHEFLYDCNLLKCLFKKQRCSLKKLIKSIIKNLSKIKVPIRPDRHCKRWGQVYVGSICYRFRIDGRNFPKVRAHKGVLYTVAP